MAPGGKILLAVCIAVNLRTPAVGLPVDFEQGFIVVGQPDTSPTVVPSWTNATSITQSRAHSSPQNDSLYASQSNSTGVLLENIQLTLNVTVILGASNSSASEPGGKSSIPNEVLLNPVIRIGMRGNKSDPNDTTTDLEKEKDQISENGSLPLPGSSDLQLRDALNLPVPQFGSVVVTAQAETTTSDSLAANDSAVNVTEDSPPVADNASKPFEADSSGEHRQLVSSLLEEEAQTSNAAGGSTAFDSQQEQSPPANESESIPSRYFDSLDALDTNGTASIVENGHDEPGLSAARDDTAVGTPLLAQPLPFSDSELEEADATYQNESTAPIQDPYRSSEFVDVEGSSAKNSDRTRPTPSSNDSDTSQTNQDLISGSETTTVRGPSQAEDETDKAGAAAYGGEEAGGTQYGTIFGLYENLNGHLKNVRNGDEIITIWINLRTAQVVGSTLNSLVNVERALGTVLRKGQMKNIVERYGRDLKGAGVT